jgi:pyruvate/2-oxoglutarate dehydrogenase complex dihydrolipoamide dehydrogenase (E3) component
MSGDDFDAIIVGAGQAGPPLAGRLTAAGMTVALVERKLFGGTCVNTGCIPTKTLIANARAAHVARRAEDFGVVLGNGGAVGVDMARVKARAHAVSASSRAGVEAFLGRMERCTVIRGQARFESPRSVRVGQRLLRSDRVFINVGGRAIVPPLPGVDRVPFLTNSSLLAFDGLPDHLVIVGGGYIGLEFAQMYRRFGSKVTIVERGRQLLGHEDADVAAAVKAIVEAEGVSVRTAAECIAFSPRPDGGVTVKLDCEEGDKEALGSHCLLAMGRRPNTDDLGLESAGVKVDARGFIVTDDELRTNVAGIWALGECNGRGAFTHTAYNDFEIVAANLRGGDRRRVSDRIEAYALYIDPPLGHAGLSEARARASGRPLLIATRPMSRVGRAVERAETQGFIKILVDEETKQIVGASILGIGGDEVIHGILDIMYSRRPYTTLQRSMGIHPTVSELLPTVLGDLAPAR